ncbi:ATP-dependent RNA helicase dbp4 [Rhizophlyctis rosea]|nr:ATP-dependent RNA helicase dbp4 [Rhizophlyctis rosea]
MDISAPRRTHSKKKRAKAAPPVSKRKLLRSSEEAELAELEEKTKDPSLYLKDEEVTMFEHIPLSKRTKKGLAEANWVEMTEIQRSSLPLSLSGKDVLGAAKTGSGKTLSFVIPVLEILYRAKWTQMDGVGALIISPTRELALQIFEVLRKAGRHHNFSAGLLIGGKDLKTEQERVGKMNILVCTPGRLLQHMDQTPDFACDNLQMLILDEADRCLDIGFEKTINAIVANLPKERQTLLFSATQTKSVRDLARLSLKDPEYVAVHDKSEHSTPKNLVQKYAVCTLPQKLDILYSFLKSHLKQKVLVFVSSCKQVRFIHETFCKMQPGIVLMCLHGKQKQPKRMAIFEQFCRKTAVCLIATDVAARGLDFPAVDWVIQLDAPEDADTYIHRVGRTARYESHGQALMLLAPSEEKGMVAALEKKKVPIEKIKINPSKTTSIAGQLQAYCSQSPELKYLGQKAFISYMRSVHLQSNKDIFDVHALPAEEFAESLGLPGAPKIKFVKKNQKKNESRQHTSDAPPPAVISAADADVSEDEEAGKKKTRTKVDKMFEKKNLTVLSDHYAKLKADDDDSEEEDEEGDFLTLARKDHDIDHIPEKLPTEAPTHRQILKEKEKELKKRGLGQKLVFDEEGVARKAYDFETLEKFTSTESIETRQAKYLEETKAKMSEADVKDKAVSKEKLREKKAARRAKERERNRAESGDGVGGVTIAGPGEGEFDNEGEWSGSGGEEEAEWSEEDEMEERGLSGGEEEEDEGEGGEFDIDLDEGSGVEDMNEDVDVPPPASPSRKRKPSVSEEDVAEEGAPSRSQQHQKKRKTKAKEDLDALDKNSLEQLALQLLGN